MRWLAFVLFASACAASSRPKLPLVTTGESSQWVRTGRYAETIALCADFARAYDGVRCDTIGKTGEGRPILALRVEKHPKLPVIYVEAGIHAGEIEGKDAGFWFVRDLLDGKVAPGALDHVSLVFVPVINPDGHERFGKNNRPNQRGPEETGWRTTGARWNLNRDWVKADAPETQAAIALIRETQPVLWLDLHTTDGAKFEHDISINMAPSAPRGDQLDEAAATLGHAIATRLTALGNLPVEFYPSFVDDANPLSGFATGDAPPRFGHYYLGARSRLGLLVETHSWRTYKERALSTYRTLQAVFEQATQHVNEWVAVEREAARADLALGGTQVPLVWEAGKGHHDIEFRGYAFEIKTSALTGGPYIVYDETRPQIWKVPLYDELTAKVTVTAPRAGYIVDGGYAAIVAPILDRHGLAYTRIAGEPRLAVETFRATKVSHGASYEGRQRAEISGAWAAETRALEQGALFVPIAQENARLVLHLFDPALPDSLAQWGFFNTAFEHKEYIEPYVIEAEAEAMIAARPGLRAEFEAALAAEPELAKSVDAKREWFYKRHPSWDERLNLLPVYRVAAPPR